MNFEQPPIYAGAKKKEDGTIDKTYAATMPDPEGKIAKKFEEQADKQERELKEGFDWEKQLVARRDELHNKNSRQGLSEHGQIELNRLTKAIEALRGA